VGRRNVVDPFCHPSASVVRMHCTSKDASSLIICMVLSLAVSRVLPFDVQVGLHEVECLQNDRDMLVLHV
jgi:hypothetical protein